jgi:Polyribonucleotide nucleotidyltransferase (polynucleotide phosphorylase)
MPDALAGFAASAALVVSDIPFNGPISEVRVARINGKFIVNPDRSELANADIDIIVGASYDNILMVEGELDEATEEDMIEAIKIAHEEIKKHCLLQIELAKELQVKKREYCHETNNEEIKQQLNDYAYQKIWDVIQQGIKNKRGSSRVDLQACKLGTGRRFTTS